MGQATAIYQGILLDNYGYENMVGIPTTVWVPGLNLVDGADSVLQPLDIFYSGAPLNWSLPGTWYMGSDGYPALR